MEIFFCIFENKILGLPRLPNLFRFYFLFTILKTFSSFKISSFNLQKNTLESHFFSKQFQKMRPKCCIFLHIVREVFFCKTEFGLIAVVAYWPLHKKQRVNCKQIDSFSKGVCKNVSGQNLWAKCSIFSIIYTIWTSIVTYSPLLWSKTTL